MPSREPSPARKARSAGKIAARVPVGFEGGFGPKGLGNLGPVPQQRCWVHKTANILDKMPKSVQGKAKQLIHEMYLAPTRKAALAHESRH